MSEETKEVPAEAPKKSNKMLMIIVLAVVVMVGGGAGAFFALKGNGSSAQAAPKKGVVTPIANSLTINLADGHYLKLSFSLQQTADAAEAVDTSEAIELAIDAYTGKTIAVLGADKSREELKTELLNKIVTAYTVDGTKEVMGIYYTSFVTQ